jgi:hypothetical protein
MHAICSNERNKRKATDTKGEKFKKRIERKDKESDDGRKRKKYKKK